MLRGSFLHSVPRSRSLVTPPPPRPTFGLHLGLYHPHRSTSSPILSIYRASSYYILLRLITTHRAPRPTSLSPRSCPPRSPSTPLSLATSRNLCSSNALGKSRTRVSLLSHQYSSASPLPVRRVEPLLRSTTTVNMTLVTLPHAFPTILFGCAVPGLSPCDFVEVSE